MPVFFLHGFPMKRLVFRMRIFVSFPIVFRLRNSSERKLLFIDNGWRSEPQLVSLLQWAEVQTLSGVLAVTSSGFPTPCSH